VTAARRSSLPAASARRTPARLYLYYGNKEAEINEAKLALERELIPNDEERRENVVDILPPTNQPLTLKSAYPQIAAELGQESLFGDSCRIVVVNQLQDLFGAWGGRGRRTKTAKASKATKEKASKSSKTKVAKPDADPMEVFLQSLSSLLESTRNAVLFLAVEDDAKNRRVNDKSPLFQGLSALGQVRNFAAKSYRFELSDAVVARSLPDAMRVITTWRREDRRAAIPVFRTLLDDVHLLIQAAILQRETPKITTDPAHGDLLFPPELRPNLQTIHEFRKRKYMSGVHSYPSIPDLLEALRGLLDIQKALYPTGDELYVPDVDYLIDVWLAKLLGQ